VVFEACAELPGTFKLVRACACNYDALARARKCIPTYTHARMDTTHTSMLHGKPNPA